MHLFCQGKPPGSKLLRLEAEIDFSKPGSPVVREITIHGDFFAIPEEAFDTLESSLKNIPLEDFAQVFEARAKELRLQLAGISGEGIVAVLRSSIDAA
ncbi:MAG: hypothetical protein FD137_728 [Spirochaetes bacterium]|nr:MAG: hypothetical protein FD137_728 [Spirochaetota bacterium]